MSQAVESVVVFPPGVRGAGHGTDGMLTAAEAGVLADLARGRTVLEVGSWCGLSALVMATTAARVFCLDWHQGDPEMGGQDTLGEFLTNLRRHAAGRCEIVPLVGDAEAVLPVLRNGAFGMAYVDGSHDAASVRRDTAHALRLTHPGGVVAWHDADRPAVSSVIAAFCPGATFGPDRLAWVERFQR